MLAAMARLGSPRMVGQFALGLAISGPVMLLANMELRFIAATDARREFRVRDYVGLRIITTIVAIFAIVVIAVAMNDRQGTAQAIIGLGLFKAVESQSDLLYGLFQQRGRNDFMGRSLMLRGPLSLAALAGGVVLTGTLSWGIGAMTVAGLGVLLLHDFPRGAQLLRSRKEDALRPGWDTRMLWRLALLSAPLGAVTMLFSLNTNLPSLLLQQKGGIAAVGIFATLVSLMTAGHVLINALGHSLSAELAARFAAVDVRGFRSAVLRLALAAGVVGASGCLVGTVWGAPILRLLFGSEYAREAPVLRWIMMAGAAAYLASSLSYAMIASRRLRIQPLILLSGIAVTFGLGLLLIPRLGLAGAALAMLGSSLVQLVANAAVVGQVLHRLSAAAEPGVVV
ncbi:MAG TPA: lipopolysaccharide biosynthesis protein [Planctomycetota bacterium]|nr:lipopolysaccharide biosynthesis protein [Planctomycetota bacterium]